MLSVMRQYTFNLTLYMTCCFFTANISNEKKVSKYLGLRKNRYSYTHTIRKRQVYTTNETKSIVTCRQVDKQCVFKRIIEISIFHDVREEKIRAKKNLETLTTLVFAMLEKVNERKKSRTTF